MTSLYSLSFLLVSIPMLSFSAFAQNEIASTDSVTAEMFKQASTLFMDGKFSESIPVYRSALERDTQRPSLEKRVWHVLIDNLGVAYGITGDFNSAERTFAYGISKDSTYPLFYYNLACTHAERDDLNGAISYLRLAYRNKANMPNDVTFPDPEDDDSFRNLRKAPEFRAAMNELKGKQPIPKVEYSGPPLDLHKEYSISQLGGGSTIFTIGSPYDETILFNLYDSDGQLELTLYQGKGGIMALSLAMTLHKYGYVLPKGKHKLVLYGKDGKAEQSLNMQ
jgi:tetratricopeptide (TPR) repeat protein